MQAGRKNRPPWGIVPEMKQVIVQPKAGRHKDRLTQLPNYPGPAEQVAKKIFSHNLQQQENEKETKGYQLPPCPNSVCYFVCHNASK
jgi:hypothetical protein